MSIKKNKFKTDGTICISLLVLIIFSFIIYSSLGITSPWGYEHNGYMGADWSNMAFHYLKLGYFNTKFGLVVDSSQDIQTGAEKYEYYTHHPIGLGLLISLSFLIFGISEWAARLVPIFINIGTVIFLYLFVKTYWNEKTAILSCFFLVFSPMFFYMRNFIATEILVVFFICAILYSYTKWLKTNQKKYFYLIFFFSILGMGFGDWGVYFIIPPILLHYFLFVKGTNKKIFYLIPTAITIFLLFLLHVWIITGSITGGDYYRGNLHKSLLFRMNMDESSKTYNITIIGVINRIIKDLRYFYTDVLTYVTALFLAIFSIKLLYKKFDKRDVLIVLVFMSFLLFLFIFSNLYWIHNFHIMYFAPIISIFTAITIYRIYSFIYNITSQNLHPILVLLIHKIFRQRYYLFLIPLILFCIMFITVSLPIYEEIYNNNFKIIPIVEFMAKNRDNIIVSYYEHPDAVQLKFYLKDRIVIDVRNKSSLVDILNNNTLNFRYFISRDDTLKDSELKNYLNVNFVNQSVEPDYLIFDLKSVK